jgi:hypothetical protein
MQIRMFISVLAHVLLVIIPPQAIIMFGQIASKHTSKTRRYPCQLRPVCVIAGTRAGQA